MPVKSGTGTGSVMAKPFVFMGHTFANVANGIGAFAEGMATSATGSASHTEGAETSAIGSMSHAEGSRTIAHGASSHSQGKYNVEDTEDIYADIVGNGSNNARSNAFALTWTGDGHYAGDVYVHSNADSTGGTKLATIEDIPDAPVQDVQVNGVSTVTDGVANVIIPEVPVQDVQIDDVSVVDSGVAKIPKAGASLGLVSINSDRGINISNGMLFVNKATPSGAKAGVDRFSPIVPYNEHEATFYGLAKAAGDSTQSASDNAVGAYTDEAKQAIQTMLDVPSKADVPTKVSDLTDDSDHYTKPAGGIPASDLAETYLTSYTETDPTVPAWAKEPTKPTYTAAEVGAPTVAEMQQAIANVNTMSIHVCAAAEYNAETGVPTIANPDT